MMMTLAPYIGTVGKRLRSLLEGPGVELGLRLGAYLTAGFCFSAAALGNLFQPLALGLCCACTGWTAFFGALGGCLGYLLLWQGPGWQGAAWLLTGLVAVVLLGDRRSLRQSQFLMPAVAGLITAVWGLVFQVAMADRTPVAMYLLRVALAGGSCLVFRKVLQGREPVCEWLTWGLGALSLAQLAPVKFLNLGYILAGALCAAAPFPAAVMAGLGVDLSGITPVPVAAVMCAGYLVRFLPQCPRWLRAWAPVAAALAVVRLGGYWDTALLPALALGGFIGVFLPLPGRVPYRRGETGVAQVRLEMAAGVLAQTRQLLQAAPEVTVDEDALVRRAAEQACAGCPCRNHCKDSRFLAQLPGPILHKSLLSPEEIPVQCRKTGRFLAQLHRSQEQLRTIRADRERQREYRMAVVQQTQFLSEFLQDLADRLPQRATSFRQVYTPEVRLYGNRGARESGDRCLHFTGVGGKYYVLLCDGMGTGPGAVQEGKNAAEILKQLLCAGYPARHALRSLNSLCALRERAAAVTVDLAELELDTGKACLYKWGSPPSWLVTGMGVEKLGLPGPPPGLSVTQYREMAEPFSLRRGELLVMASDGMEPDQVRVCCQAMGIHRPPGELARALMACGQVEDGDDATLVLISLKVKE